MAKKIEEIQLPDIPKKLLESLNELFPERSAELEWSEKEIWFRAGQRNVLRFLNSHFNIQNNINMEKK